MSKTCYIFGAGGHARVIASFLSAEPVFVVFKPTEADQMSEDFFFENLPAGDVYIGIGSNKVRSKVAERLRLHQIKMPPCIAPTAFIARDATIDDGAVICAGAVIGSRAHIGRDTIVNSLSSVDHDCVLGQTSQVTAGVTFGGDVKVGENCFFGVKSAVIPGISIGDNVQVMAGSVVVSNVSSNVLVGGNPARQVRCL